ncbi:MAG: hypothetical protein KDK90_22375 [Leptospiraceae bacterium]|nr:hypothetical protein [Leptospiraceae bacterium]
MELKSYQQEVINDLSLFLEHVQETKDIKKAYYNFWVGHPKTSLQPFPGSAIEPYKNNIPRVPHICIKVPTAGGKKIKTKTANLNELKNENLMSKDCPVRYIITVNALKEGWDCSFAYILASLADKSSAVDVEQILGRVLRQPYVMKHNFPLLNLSYVLTASSKFLNTLDNIVKGLNKAGFSDKDYS